MDIWDTADLEEAADIPPPLLSTAKNTYFDQAVEEQTELDFGPDVDFGAMFKEHRIYGPPGCGKTFYAAKLVAHFAKEHPKAKFLITSLTRTGAAAARGRIELHKDSFVGTLHAVCYKMYGRPKLADLMVEDFNKKFPMYALSPKYRDLENGVYPGDRYRELYFKCRNNLLPESEYNSGVMGKFIDRYEGWKAENEFMDYQDLLYRAYLHADRDPIEADFILGDEAQDWPHLGFALMRKWGNKVQAFYLVGDPDQAIFTFNGAAPHIFQSVEIPQHNIIQLKQSYRCPSSVLKVAMPWIEQIKDRVKQVYEPRRTAYRPPGPFVEGSVVKSGATWQSPMEMVSQAWRDVGEGKSVMVMASCGYMLKPTIEIMRKLILPFSNPFAPDQKSWSPLAVGRRDEITSTTRVLCYLKGNAGAYGAGCPDPTANDLALWVEYCKAYGVALPKMKGKIEDMRGSSELIDFTPPTRTQRIAGDLAAPLPEYSVYRFLTPEAIQAWTSADLSWLEASLMSSKEAMLYPIRVALKHGTGVLRERHRLFIGTIHSFKGHEADVIYIVPDLSSKFWEQWTGPKADREALIRLGYVALTRARERAVILTPAGAKTFNFNLNPSMKQLAVI